MSSILTYRSPNAPSDIDIDMGIGSRHVHNYNKSRQTHAPPSQGNGKMEPPPAKTKTKTHPPVFESNVGAAFLASLRVALKQCFGSMHRAVLKKGGDVDAGLNKIHEICTREAAHIQKQFPAILLQYQVLMLQFSKTQFSATIHAANNGAFQNKHLTIAPFPLFIKTLLQNISESEEMRSLSYFQSMTFSEQNIFFHDMVLITMSQSTSIQNRHQITPSDSPSSAPVKYIYGAGNSADDSHRQNIQSPAPTVHGSSLLY